MQACDFIRDPHDMEILTRTIIGPAGRPVRVLLRVLDSSVTADDDRNRELIAQKRKSARVRRSFLAALDGSDVVFYLGHSRDGGGPDFSPPRLGPDSHVRYASYRSNPRALLQPGRQPLARGREDPLLRWSVGVGIRRATVIGPIQVDVGFNPAPLAEREEDLVRLHVSLGAL